MMQLLPVPARSMLPIWAPQHIRDVAERHGFGADELRVLHALGTAWLCSSGCAIDAGVPAAGPTPAGSYELEGWLGNGGETAPPAVDGERVHVGAAIISLANWRFLYAAAPSGDISWETPVMNHPERGLIHYAVASVNGRPCALIMPLVDTDAPPEPTWDVGAPVPVGPVHCPRCKAAVLDAADGYHRCGCGARESGVSSAEVAEMRRDLEEMAAELERVKADADLWRKETRRMGLMVNRRQSAAHYWRMRAKRQTEEATRLRRTLVCVDDKARSELERTRAERDAAVMAAAEWAAEADEWRHASLCTGVEQTHTGGHFDFD